MTSSLDKDRAKICILTSGHSPFDGRIFHKEAKTLVNAGYSVVLIAQHNKEEIVDGVRILPLPEPRNRFERMTKLTWKLFRLALKEKANIYHFHGPELIPVGIGLKVFGKKVIYDVHEDFPEQLLHKEWIRSYRLRQILSAFLGLVEKSSVKILDSVITVTPDITRKFPESKTIMLRNLPVLELIDKVAPVQKQNEKPVVIYAGWLTGIRGTRELIQAMEIVGDRTELWLLGKWESEEFRKECEHLHGWKYTKYLGFVSLNEVYGYLKIADIGISLLYPIKYYLTSLPVKAYEYMVCSLPMVLSNFSYWQEIFGECALFANPYDSNEIADRILYLLDNPHKVKQLGRRGRQLTEEKYNWEVESNGLIELYKKLLV